MAQDKHTIIYMKGDGAGGVKVGIGKVEGRYDKLLLMFLINAPEEALWLTGYHTVWYSTLRYSVKYYFFSV
jgi:hypothetical protein